MQQNGRIDYYLITEKTNDPFIFTSRLVSGINVSLLMYRIQKYGIEELLLMQYIRNVSAKNLAVELNIDILLDHLFL